MGVILVLAWVGLKVAKRVSFFRLLLSLKRLVSMSSPTSSNVTDHVTAKPIIQKYTLYCLTTIKKKETALGAIANYQLAKKNKDTIVLKK